MRERSEMILADLIQIRAEQKPDLDVLTFEHLSLDGGATPDEVRSYTELATNANRIAAGLLARGVERGDRVAVMMRNHPEFVETLIACSILGALLVPVDPRTRGEKLAYMLRKAGCCGVVCADHCLAEIASVREQAPDLAWILLLETGEEAADLGAHDAHVRVLRSTAQLSREAVEPAEPVEAARRQLELGPAVVDEPAQPVLDPRAL